MRPTRLHRPTTRVAFGLLAVAAALAACTAPAPEPAPEPAPGQTSPTPEPEETPMTTPPPPPPPPPLAWGPSQADVDAAIEDAGGLADDALAGQVIVARYAGTDPAIPAGLVSDLHLGGVILFSENVASLDQVIATADAVQAVGATDGRDWPTIVSVDNEGGRVQRLSGASGPWTTFPSFSHAGAASSQVITDAMAAMAVELRASGINTDYAPDADVLGPGDAAIGNRSPSQDPGTAARAVAAAVTGFTTGGVLSSIKHFPGHGGLSVDSHRGLPVQTGTTADLLTRDLIPFEAGIEAGAPMVMIGHIDVTDWDPGIPASLSPVAYQFLREDLHFTGVTITDGLDMGALNAFGDSGEIAVTALNAGADILLTPPSAAGAHAGILAALSSGGLERATLEAAAGRVIAMMRWQARLATEAGPVSADDVGSAAQAAADLAAGG